MPLQDFFLILVGCALLMLACRVLPMMLLKGKHLRETVVRALGFIPPAAFAALVANDLFDPADFTGGDAAAWLVPLLAALVVGVVGVKTKSMVWCIVIGVASYGLLTLVPLPF